jgi:hypothetical protein
MLSPIGDAPGVTVESNGEMCYTERIRWTQAATCIVGGVFRFRKGTRSG